MFYRLKDLGNKNGKEFIHAFTTIPANTITLDLINNALGVKTVIDLVDGFNKIPACVSSLNLDSNDFDKKTDAELIKILLALPVNIESVLIGNRNIDLVNLRKIPSLDVHNDIIYWFKRLGYESTSGVCHGSSLRWLEACFLDEETLFDERIKNIVSDSEKILQSINLIKEQNERKLKKGGKAGLFPEHLLDILAFSDSLELYQSPLDRASLFSKVLNQENVDEISYFASSDKVASRGGLTQIYSESGIYTKTEIKEYLDSLGAILERSASLSKEPIGIHLSNCRHAMALTYNPGVGWKFMDINQYPTKKFKITETDLIAAQIIKGYDTIKGPYTCFETSVITLGKNVHLPELRCQLDQFKKSHVITKEIANRKEIDGLNLAALAAYQGHADAISELAKHNANLDTPNIDGNTPAFFAAQNGHAHVITELAKHNANLDTPNNSGNRPAFVAAQEGYAHVIAELAKHKVNLNTSSESGATPAFAAADKGHLQLISELIKYGVDLYSPCSIEVIQLKNIAKERGQLVIDRMNLFLLGQKITYDFQETLITPYEIAVIEGHNDVFQLLISEAYNAVLQAGMISIDLSNRLLGLQTGTEIAKALKTIPDKITSLNLSKNFLHNITDSQLHEALQAIPKTVTALNLSKNELRYKSGNDLARLLKAIPSGITTLDLSSNKLSVWASIEAFQEIPANITMLNLSNNYFDLTWEWAVILNAIPASVKSVRIDDKIIDIPAFKKIDNEIYRLATSRSRERSFLVSIGLIEASDSKFNALEKLRSILINGTLIDKKPEELHNQLRDWKETYGECIAKQRNCIHSFFSPNHKTTAAIAVNEVFAALNMYI